MRIEQALDFLHASNATQFESLSDLTPPSSSPPSSAKRASLLYAVARSPWSA